MLTGGNNRVSSQLELPRVSRKKTRHGSARASAPRRVTSEVHKDVAGEGNPRKKGFVVSCRRVLVPGMLLSSGEIALTVTGRETTPFPRIDLSTNRRAQNTLRRVDRWLMQNALDEAISRGDRFNARQFSAHLDKPSPSDKDSAEIYLTCLYSYDR